jgi:hypothetical protein
MTPPVRYSQGLSLSRRVRGVLGPVLRPVVSATWHRYRRWREARRFERVAPIPLAATGSRLTIVFAPEGGVTPHFVALAVTARTLQELGERVLVARCFNAFRRCATMDNQGLEFERTRNDQRATCVACAVAGANITEAYGLKTVDLRSFMTPEIEARIAIALRNPASDLRELTFEGIPFGKLCAGDVAFAKKIADYGNPAPDVRSVWLQYISSAMTSYAMVQRMCAVLPVSHLVHFNDYSMMLGARLAAERAGVRVTGMTQASHLNIDRRRYVALPTVWRPIAHAAIKRWPEWREYPLPAAIVHEITDDSLLHFSGVGSHVYSSAKTLDDNVVTRLGLSKEKTLLVAFTSSLDERRASELYMEALGLEQPPVVDVFGDQIAWLRSVVEFVQNRANLQLVVRVHPREGANRRDKIESQHLLKLRSAFAAHYDRCRFVWPEEQVSSYDLGEAADVVLVSWSTIGLELARLGVPVLASTRGIGGFPVGEFIAYAETPEQYFETLDKLRARPTELGRIASAYRWYHQYFLVPSIDLRDLVGASDNVSLPDYSLPQEGRTLRDVIVGGQSSIDINLQRLRRGQNATSEREETEALRSDVRRLIHYFMTGEVRSSDEGTGGEIAVQQREVRYSAGGKISHRHSPLVARLATLVDREATSGSPDVGKS